MKKDDLLKYVMNKDQVTKLIKEFTNLKSEIERDIHDKQHKQEEVKEQTKEMSIPVHADLSVFDLGKFAEDFEAVTSRRFDAVMIDPPWQLSTSDPARGVTIKYPTMTDDNIMDLDIGSLQTDGFLFLWAINSKIVVSLKMIKEWGYKLVDEIQWVKLTVKGKIAKGHAHYLQHSKETCFVAVKGNPEFKGNTFSDVIIE